MRLFNKVVIIGVGLIGGSLALAIKKKQLANEIIGISRRRRTLIWAKSRHAIDKGCKDLNIVKDADLIILATPINTILKLASRISLIVNPRCIVSDVGSTKKEIVSKLKKLFPKYIGSHPLAGSEKRGIMNADVNIFQDSLCILTPEKDTDRKSLEKIKRLWNQIGARVIFLTPKTHDRILSFVSHLPHLVAFSLMGVIPRQYLRFSAAGLKDTTRIAASDNKLWEDILLSNKNNILKTIDLFQEELSKIKSAVGKEDKRLLSKILKEAKKKRDSLD